MTATSRSPWPVLCRTLVYMLGLWALADVLLVRMQADDAWTVFGEHGRLENLQVALLAVILTLCVACALRSPATRPLSILLAGIAAAALVREHNNNWFKDHVGLNAWQAAAGVVIVTSWIVAFKAGGRVRDCLVDLTSRPAFGWLAAGLVVFLYGQVLDERYIWDLLLDRNVPYAAQRMAEECAETAGYWLIAAGLLEWWIGAPRKTDAAA